MKIYDKNNKLNIDFENDNAPDIKLWKDAFGSHVKIGNLVYGDKVQIEKIADYLYKMTFDDYSLNDVDERLKNFKFNAACSGIHNGNYYGRNYDWYYSNTATVIVVVPAKNGRHASIGVACHDDITDLVAGNSEYVEAFKALPYFTLDGINDAGVVCSTNVVPLDKGITTGTNAGKRDLCLICMPRIILDSASSALDGINKLNDYNIWSLVKLLGIELHMMVADNNSTYIVEFVNNKMHIMSDQDDEFDNIPNDKGIMTNFHLTDWSGEIKAVSLGDSEDAVKATGLEDHADGLERYKVLQEKYSSMTSLDTTLNAMDAVKYTLMYDIDMQNPWYSECNGTTETFGELNIYSSASDYDGIMAKMKDMYENRDRNRPDTWQTIHSTAYDLDSKTFAIKVQEESTVYKFDIEGNEI